MEARIEVAGRVHDVRVRRTAAGWDVEVDGASIAVQRQTNGSTDAFRANGNVHHVKAGPDRAVVDGETLPFRILSTSGGMSSSTAQASGPVRVKPPMIGRLESLRVQAGDRVEKGQVLFVLEAMKMHNEVKAPVAGVVKAIHAAAGATLDVGQVVLELDSA